MDLAEATGGPPILGVTGVRVGGIPVAAWEVLENRWLRSTAAPGTWAAAYGRAAAAKTGSDRSIMSSVAVREILK